MISLTLQRIAVAKTGPACLVSTSFVEEVSPNNVKFPPGWIHKGEILRQNAGLGEWFVVKVRPKSLHGGIEPEDVIYDQTNQVTSLLQVVMVTNNDI